MLGCTAEFPALTSSARFVCIAQNYSWRRRIGGYGCLRRPTASARLDGRDERGAQQATAPLIRRRQLIGMDGLARPGRQERRVFFLEYALASLDPVNERRQLLFTCCNIAGNDWIVCVASVVH